MRPRVGSERRNYPCLGPLWKPNDQLVYKRENIPTNKVFSSNVMELARDVSDSEDHDGHDSFAAYDFVNAAMTSFDNSHPSFHSSNALLDDSLPSSYFDSCTLEGEDSAPSLSLGASHGAHGSFASPLTTTSVPQSPHVHFGPVTVREYEVVNDPNTKDCCRLSLGWRHGPEKVIPYPVLGSSGSGKRSQRLTFRQRRNRLAVVQGWTLSSRALLADDDDNIGGNHGGGREGNPGPSVDHAQVA